MAFDGKDYVLKSSYLWHSIFVWCFLGIASLGVFVLYYWIFDSRPVIEVIEAYPSKGVYQLGEPIVITARYNIVRVCRGDAARSVVDKFGGHWPVNLIEPPLLAKGIHVVNFPFDMPVALKAGNYRFESTVTWNCNPLDNHREKLLNVPFTVSNEEYKDPKTEKAIEDVIKKDKNR